MPSLFVFPNIVVIALSGPLSLSGLSVMSSLMHAPVTRALLLSLFDYLVLTAHLSFAAAAPRK